MFKTKAEIDKHVRLSLSKLRDNEKNLRGYSIAKLYFKIGEYKTAEQWISLYLKTNDNCAAAHKFHGQCFEKLKKPEQQLLAYQRSLQLDKKQNDLLIEVCKLLQLDELSNYASTKAKYWYDLAESRGIQDDAVLNVKLKYLNNGDNGSDSWKSIHEILLKEIVQRPNNVGLRLRLLRTLVDQNKVDEAFKSAFDLELKRISQFRNSIDWYATLGHVLAKYKDVNEAVLGKDWSYWLLLITSLERHLFLILSQTSNDSSIASKNVIEATGLLFNFDQALHQLTVRGVRPAESDSEMLNEFLNHFRGQFCLHASTLLFKREQIQTPRNNWRETTKTAMPLLLLAYNCGRTDRNRPWLRSATEQTKLLINAWSAESCFRCCQAGRTLLSCVDQSTPNDIAFNNLRSMFKEKIAAWTSSDDVINEIRRYTTDSDWRKKMYRLWFNKQEQLAKAPQSYFINCKQFASIDFVWPLVSDLETDEEVSQVIDPSSLARFVYLALGFDALSTKSTVTAISPDVRCRVFNELNFSISNLVNCGAETLNQLDIDTFLYATTIHAKRSLELERIYLTGNSSIAGKPRVLPFANMSSRLCNEEQNDWWIAAYKVYKNISGDELASLRATLQHGIEAVRGIGSPKMDLIILLKLGQIFYKRSQESTKTVERGFLESRTTALFKYSLYMLRMQNSHSSLEPFRRLFKYGTGNSQFELDSEINALAEEAITFLAGRYFRNSEFEECIDDLSGINLPFATYFQAEAYRKMTELSNTPKKNKRVYLEKARDYLAQTIDLLDAPNVDKNHPLRSIVDTDVKRLQQESRKLETSLTDSFVSANGRSDLDESITRVRDTSMTTTPNVISAAAASAATAAAVAQNEKLERLIREMMESLVLLKDDVADVRTKVNSIEEQLNKQQDNKSIDPLEDYYLLEDELQSAGNYLNNTSMFTNVSRMQTSSGNQSQNRGGVPPFVPPQHQAVAAAAMGSPYNAMSPLFNGVYQQMQMNQAYQAALNAASTVTPNRNSSFPNFASPQLTYGNDQMAAYNLQQQYQPTPPSALMSMNMLQQPNQASPIPQMQQPTPNVPFSLNTNPVELTSSTTQFPPLTATAPVVAQPNVVTQSTPKSKFIQNNAPVEKTPPVNVVITSSDPLPLQNTVTMSSNQQALSVTIPPQHLKGNTIPTATSTPSKSNPSIMAALLDKKTASPAIEKPVKGTTSTTPKPTVAEQKSIFGNALAKTPSSATPFSSPASSVFTKTATVEKPANDATAKVNPFAALSFGKPTIDSKTAEPKPLFSFGNLTSTPPLNVVATPEKKDEVTNSSLTKDDDAVEEFVPTAHFEPVIKLSEVEVKTGEENETILFEHRAKLLRYVKELKEWKERGLGNMKVLVNKDDPNKVRLLMRREQVFKLCCNQLITKDTKFLPKTDTSLTWYGQDYSENELQVELLAIRFRDAAVCKQFHDAILNAQKNMTEGGSEAPKQTTTEAPKKSEKGFGDQFKPKAGSWTCEGCYCTNKETDVACVACNTSKDGKAAVEKIAAPTSKFTFKFGNANAQQNAAPAAKTTSTSSGFGDQFKPKAGAWSCKGCYTSNTAETLYCVCCEEPKDDTVPKKEKGALGGLTTATTTKFSFGNLGTANAAAASTAATSTTTSFSFGAKPTTNTGSSFAFASTPTTTASNEAPKFSFGSAATATSNSNNNSGASGFTFTPSKPIEIAQPKIESKEFGFVFKPKSPGKAKSPLKPHLNSGGDGVEDVSDDDNVEEEENTTYFTPVIALPDKVDVKTGEEDESVLYSHRAKLFRFRDGEWKERGLGDVKILQHKQSGRMRVVMRREQILKICLNHTLTHDIEYKPKDTKSWHFVVNDYSEGELESLVQFCLRFKTEEIAQEFKKAIDDALNGVTSKQNGNSENGETSVAPRQLAVEKQTTEEKQMIDELKLPSDFFEYKHKDECGGCRGCNADEFVFGEVKPNNEEYTDDNPLPLELPARSKHNDLSKSSQSTATTTFSFNSFSSTKPLFGAQTVTTSAETKFNSSSFLFGNVNSNAQPAFSPLTTTKSIFGNSATPVKPPTFAFGGQGNATGATTDAEKSETAPTVTTTSPPSFSFGQGNNVFGTVTTTSPTQSTKATFSFTTAATDSSKSSTPSTLFGGFAFASGPNTTTVTSSTSDTPKPIFGSSFGSATTPSPSLFGGNTTTPSLTAPLSSSTPADTPSQGETKNTPLFVNSGGLSFADLSKKTPNDSSSVEPQDLSTKAVAQTGFGDLAAEARKTNSGAFNTSGNASQGGFFGLSHKDDFSLLSRPLNGSATATSHDGDESTEDPNYDPHYDPIIELPDEIQISTGEENEQKLFGDRAKLYRFDGTSREWKERGVGEFKILHHAGNRSYRLLLRREQIHKCVLNMALTVHFQINYMKNNDKAFCWVGQNFAEDTENGVCESLSVRFKKPDIAKNFKQILDDCLEELKSRGDLQPEQD